MVGPPLRLAAATRDAATRDAEVPLTSGEYFGVGWHGVERAGEQTFRWNDRDAVLLVPAVTRSAVRVSLDATPAAAAEGIASVTLRVNGIPVGTRALTDGAERHVCDVPAGTWLTGTNELWFRASVAIRPADTGGRDTRTLALHVTRIAIGLAGTRHPGTLAPRPVMEY
jgi:hypothetical protein